MLEVHLSGVGNGKIQILGQAVDFEIKQLVINFSSVVERASNLTTLF